ncbi:MAG: hypothetical protein ACJATX_000536 [Candidatus Paceibacteria bacterium]|jgi:hypothetical protein
MKTLFKTSIIAFVALLATSTFAFTFEDVDMTKKTVSVFQTQDTNILNSLLKQKALAETVNNQTIQNFEAPEVENEGVSDETSAAIQLNSELSDLNSAINVQTTFAYGEVMDTSELELQIEVLLFQLEILSYMSDPDDSDIDIINAGLLSNEDDFEVVFGVYDPLKKYVMNACGEYIDGDGELRAVCGIHTVFGNPHIPFTNPDVTTLGATLLSDDLVKLNAEFESNSAEDELLSFFVYGFDSSSINDIEDDYNSFAEIEENGDDLQKESVGVLDQDDEEDFVLHLNNLELDTEYSYIACVEFLNEITEVNLSCGSEEEFWTGNGQFYIPEVETLPASEIHIDYAYLNGELEDLNDADEVEAFFVVSDDDEYIDDIEEDYNVMSAISTNNLDVVYYDDLNDEANFEETITDLTSDTRYFFRACLEYEDFDGDDHLVCGDIKDITTLQK